MVHFKIYSFSKVPRLFCGPYSEMMVNCFACGKAEADPGGGGVGGVATPPFKPVTLENFYSIFYSICRFLGIIAERVILHTA